MGKNLELYFDESGDFSIGNDPTDLLIISVAVADKTGVLECSLSVLESELARIGYTGLIHTAPLVRKAGDYSELELWQRREIFWALYNFTVTANIATFNFVFEKQNLPDSDTLRKQVDDAMTALFDDVLTGCDTELSQVLYDDGQRPLMEILYDLTENRLSPDQYCADFDHTKNRIFQVADLMTYVQRVIYKLKHGIMLSKSDKLFFTKDNLQRIQIEHKPKTTP